MPFPTGVILTVAVFQAEGRIPRADRRPQPETPHARSLARASENAGLRDDAVEVEQDCLRTLNQIKRILQANALKLVQTRRS